MAKITEHTPGPWRVGDREPYVEIWGPMLMNAYPVLASMEAEPREANARLIAAAPDLLAALPDLFHVISWLENGCDPRSAVKELRIYQSRIDTAKAKAEGRP